MANLLSLLDQPSSRQLYRLATSRCLSPHPWPSKVHISVLYSANPLLFIQQCLTFCLWDAESHIVDVGAHIPAHLRPKSTMRRSLRKLISATPSKVTVPVKVASQDTSPIRVSVFSRLPQSLVLISHMTCIFMLQKERRSKKRAELISPPPHLPSSKPKPQKKKGYYSWVERRRGRRGTPSQNKI